MCLSWLSENYCYFPYCTGCSLSIFFADFASSLWHLRTQTPDVLFCLLIHTFGVFGCKYPLCTNDSHTRMKKFLFTCPLNFRYVYTLPTWHLYFDVLHSNMINVIYIFIIYIICIMYIYAYYIHYTYIYL